MKFTRPDIEFMLAMNEDKPTTKPPHLVSEYIEGKRVLPSSSPIPGPWENWRSHYAVEIMDCFSPYNPTRWIDMMSAAQVVKTSIIENVIGYGMDVNPSPMLYVSGTDALLSKWTKRLEPLIDSLDIRHKMVAPIEKKESRTTGDKNKQKIFTGGFLEMGSAQSPTSLRFDSIKILFLDEVDSAPRELTTGEGRWDLVAEARTKAWEARKKIGAFSTPTEYETSIIYDRYLLGDQCLCMVPCPFCNKFQILERGSENGIHGLKAETEAGDLKYVYYICDYCHEAIFEHHKNIMIPKCRWEPQAKPEKFRRSFQINSLYSPVGAYSWLSYWMDYQTAKETPDGMRSFTNLQDGLPYREKGARPEKREVITLRGTYSEYEVQDYVLFLTMSVDVQRGSEKKGKKPQRLEVEVLGHSSKYRSASVCHRVFDGDISDAFGGAWEELHKWALETGLIFKTKKGIEHSVAIVFVDSGDGEYTDIVYEFTGRWKNTFPIKGFRALKKRKNEKGDEVGPHDFKRYRAQHISDSITLYEISTNYYKRNFYNNLYNSIKAIQREEDTSRAGFCDFPRDYKDEYFDTLTAEEMKRDGTFHKTGDNEGLDLRVYNMCAGDVYLDSQVLLYKSWAKDQGWNVAQIQRIDTKWVLNDMEKALEIKHKKAKKT